MQEQELENEHKRRRLVDLEVRTDDITPEQELYEQQRRQKTRGEPDTKPENHGGRKPGQK